MILFVSVIIRTKDRPIFLKRAIDSVYSQTYSNIEIVIVNDNGCDLSEIINYYKILKCDKGISRKIEYIYNKRCLKRAGAANVGLVSAKGKYIGFLDDDDYYFADHILSHVSAQKTHKKLFSISIATESIEDMKMRQKERVYRFPRDLNKISLLFFENYFPFNSMVFQKSVIKTIGILDEDRWVLEDWDFIIRLFLQFEPVLINSVTCEYSTRSDSSTVRNNFEYRQVWKDNFMAVINKYKLDRKNNNVLVPLSEISDFLADHAKEWYETSIQWDLLRDSLVYKVFYSNLYMKVKKVARFLGLTRG